MSTSTFITNRVKDNKNIYHSSGGINVSYDNKMNWLGRWDKIMNALINLYVWYLFFFDIYVEEYIYKDLTNLKNDAKYKETYWKAFDQISHLSIFLDIKTIVEIHEITNGKSVKIVLVPAKVTLGY